MLSRSWARRALSAPKTPRCRTILRITPLEERTVPATFRWVNPTSGDFATASNWQDQAGNPGVPTAADDALILTSGITVASTNANAVRNLTSTATIDITAGTLTAAAANLLGQTDVVGGSLILNGSSSAA